eukprot:7131839-Ditylum_brightwellii.AAC.1
MSAAKDAALSILNGFDMIQDNLHKWVISISLCFAVNNSCSVVSWPNKARKLHYAVPPRNLFDHDNAMDPLSLMNDSLITTYEMTTIHDD